MIKQLASVSVLSFFGKVVHLKGTTSNLLCLQIKESEHWHVHEGLNFFFFEFFLQSNL